jgi:hypothetical protein
VEAPGEEDRAAIGEPVREITMVIGHVSMALPWRCVPAQSGSVRINAGVA